MGTYFTNYEWVIPNDNAIVSTSSVQEVPSNKKPLLNLTCNGVLLPSDKTYDLILRFSLPFPAKDLLASSYGTFCIGKRVLNAVKVVKSAYDREKQELVLILDLRQVCTIKRATRFSFSIQLNDCEAIEGCSNGVGICNAQFCRCAQSGSFQFCASK